MTDHPGLLAARPSSRDALSDILRSFRLTRALYYRVSTSTPWPTIRVPAGTALVGAFGGRSRSVVSYHVVVEGSCWTGLDGGPPVRLEPGDIVVYPRGDAYFLSCGLPPGGPEADAAPLVGLLRAVSSGQMPASITFGGSSDRTIFVCGFLGCDPRPSDPLLASLPPIFHVSRAQGRLARLVELALAEVDRAAADDPVRERLSESLFLETVREHLATSPGNLAWLGSGGDTLAARALSLLHEEPGRPWTLALLAAETGASRSVLADRFVRSVGKPPMRYLADLRLQLAAELLASATMTVAAVAHETGYGSEATFSRAFKRSTGLAPGAWRDGRSSS